MFDQYWIGFRRLLTPVTLLGMILIAMLLLTVILIVMFVAPVQAPTGSIPTARMNIIPAATATSPLPTATATPPATQTPEILPSPLPGVIGVGAYVQVNGTGTDGLRVRFDPGLNGKTIFVAIESEVFLVTDGPRDEGGYTWWRLVSPSNDQNQGWAVANYLVAIEKP